MEIEVGEYIRTNLGRIGKVTEITKEYIFTDIEANCIAFRNCNHFFKETFDKVVKKHSKNIIDLIEVGDIVTYWLGVGYYTTRTVDVDFLKQIKDTFINKDIKSIVTKEQMHKMVYKV